MSRDRTKGRRANPKAFRPALEGQRLEPRLVMATTGLALSQYLLTHPSLANAYAFNNPKFVTGSAAHPFPVKAKGDTKALIDTQTARGGQSVVVATPDGSRFRISISLADNQFDGGLAAQTGGSGTGVIPSNTVQPIGTVRAYSMPGGRVGLIVDGTTANQQLTIDPLPFPQRKGYAHSFAYLEGNRSHVLDIGSLNVTSGSIQAILGFHSANLSGPLTIGGTTKVDRIAFNALLPGAAIGVGGTLNTLDINNGATLTAGPGISVGGDLNLLNVGQDLILTNGASIQVGRFAGLTLQPPKGTGTGSNILSLNQSQIGTGTSQLTPSISAYIQGNVTIGPGSVLKITNGIANSSASSSSSTASTPSPFLINGSLNAISPDQLEIPNLQPGTSFTTSSGSLILSNNFVARGGFNFAT